MEHIKDKDQSILEYFEALQREYFENEVRAKIYPVIKDKKFYRRVMEYKRNKIEDIAYKNKLKSIFNDEDIKRKYASEVYDCLFLTDEELILYYTEGADVQILVDDDYKIGVIIKLNFECKTVNVKLQEEEKVKEYDFIQILRIL